MPVFRRRIRRAVATVVGILAVALGLRLALEVVLTPWARSFGLWPTLTGRWVGELTMLDGRVSPVYFELGGGMPSGRHGRSYINGRARWCDGSGEIRDYTVSGTPENYRGTRFHLSTSSVVERTSGVSPAGLQGEWSVDEIRGRSELFTHARRATATASRAVDETHTSVAKAREVRYRLQRGSESDFLSACRALNTALPGSQKEG